MDVKLTTTFDNICRTCNLTGVLVHKIFQNDRCNSEFGQIYEMLMVCTGVKVSENDEFSKVICDACLQQLQLAYMFRRKCLQTEKLLRQSRDNAVVFQSNNDNNILSCEVQVNVAHSNVSTEGQLATCFSDHVDFLSENRIIFTCCKCSQIFSSLDGLRDHKLVVHQQGHLVVEETIASGCTVKQQLSDTLPTPKQSQNLPKVIVVCKICGKSSSRVEHIRRHLLTHLKTKPYPCNSCSRSFNRLEHLTSHSTRCPATTGKVYYTCSQCNRNFNREDSLKVHETIHDNEPKYQQLDNLDHAERYYYEMEIDSYDNMSNGSSSRSSFLEGIEVDGEIMTEEPNLPGDVTHNTCNASMDDTSVRPQDNEPANSVDYSQLMTEQPSQLIELEAMKLHVDSDVTSLPLIPKIELESKNKKIDRNDDNRILTENTAPVVAMAKRGRGRPRKFPLGFSKKEKNVKKRIVGRRRNSRPRVIIEDIDAKSDLLSATVLDGMDDKRSEKLTNEEFSCSQCSRSFTVFSRLDEHLRLKHNMNSTHKCTICDKEFRRYAHLKRHLSCHTSNKKYSCAWCCKRFGRMDHLKKHTDTHKLKKHFLCDIEYCIKTFSSEERLLRHKAARHNVGEKIRSEKKFSCQVCPKSFTTEKYREVHMRGHQGDRQHTCQICKKIFLCKSHLTEHMKFHDDKSKKFLCSECGQRFIRNDYLIIHMRRHRGEKPFKCKFCGKGFPRTTDLRVHERYHTGEKTHLCVICGRGFGRAYNLTVHMRTHTGEKPYQCTYCVAAFAQGNDLKAHLRRHTGERFQCELCSENFLMGYLLTQHKRMIHGLNVVSNIRRLQSPQDLKSNLDNPPITIKLPKPIVPTLNNVRAHYSNAFQEMESFL